MGSAALRNLYQQILDGDVELAYAPEPDPDVPSLSPFFGCGQWTPAREFGTMPLEWCCILETREVCVVEVCRVCYSGYGDVKVPESLVCMGQCGRSRHDEQIKAILRDYPPPRIGEMGPLEKAEADAARAARRKEAEKAARKGRPKAGSDAYLMGAATMAKFAS